MARSAAHKAASAAEALEAFLRHRPPSSAGVRGPEQPASGETNRRAAATEAREPLLPAHAVGSGAAAARCSGALLRLPHTDWLRHALLVSGPPAVLAAFRGAASGAGCIPWQLDLDSLQEDWFLLLANPAHRQLSLFGARVLAEQLRQAVGHRHALAVSRVGHSRACPFDLHSLVPVPASILQLGPDHPDALGWLWQHWGTTEALRHVAPEPTGKTAPRHDADADAGEAALRLSFWSADWSPWRAIARIRADWPALHFDVQPDYAGG